MAELTKSIFVYKLLNTNNILLKSIKKDNMKFSLALQCLVAISAASKLDVASASNSHLEALDEALLTDLMEAYGGEPSHCASLCTYRDETNSHRFIVLSMGVVDGGFLRGARNHTQLS